jgi:hypothetical protein
MQPTRPEHLIHHLVAGDASAIATIVEASRASDDPLILVAAALFAPDGGDGLVTRAGAVAATSRDRQLVAIATAHLRGDRELVDALARDHLVDHPDNVLVAWIAGASRQATAAPHSPPFDKEPS